MLFVLYSDSINICFELKDWWKAAKHCVAMPLKEIVTWRKFWKYLDKKKNILNSRHKMYLNPNQFPFLLLTFNSFFILLYNCLLFPQHYEATLHNSGSNNKFYISSIFWISSNIKFELIGALFGLTFAAFLFVKKLDTLSFNPFMHKLFKKDIQIFYIYFYI